MNLTNLFQCAIGIAITAWLSHALGKFLVPEHAWGFALIGGTIAAIAFVCVAFYPDDPKKSDLVGTVLNVSGILFAGFFLADHPWLWLTLAVANVPIYVFSARAMFKSTDSLLEELGAAGGDSTDMTLSERIDKFGVGFAGLFYVAGCAGFVTAQYKATAYFFLN